MSKLKIAIFEPFKGSGDYATVPFDQYWLAKTHPDYNATHADRVCMTYINTIHEKAPKFDESFELRLYPNNGTGFSKAKLDGCLIANMSQLDWRHVNGMLLRYEDELSEKAIMFCGAGNDGAGGESDASARNDVWISVGAVDKYGNPKSYSSYGEGNLDIVGLSGQYGWEGTSFASPYAVALTSIYYMYHYDELGYYPSPAKAKKWVYDNLKDVYTPGEDDRTALGMLQLPDQFEFSKEDAMIPEGNSNRPGILINPTYITIHNTGNSDVGANAQMHAAYLLNASTSWHYTVDDQEHVQHLPDNEKGLHTGTNSGNMCSIGVEICENRNGNYKNAEENAIKLIDSLMRLHKIPVENVVPHQHWSGKYCPHIILDNGWDNFINKVDEYNNISPWAYESWVKSVDKGINDGFGAKNSVTEEQLMVFFDRLGLL